MCAGGEKEKKPPSDKYPKAVKYELLGIRTPDPLIKSLKGVKKMGVGIKYEMINGEKTKLYPAFNTEKHAHDIEFRYNRCKNIMCDMELREIEWDDETYDKLEQLSDRLDEIRSYSGNYYPMT